MPKDELQRVMLVARRPFFAYRHEPHAFDMIVALLFPVSARIRVAIEGLLEPVNGALHVCSRPMSLIGRKAYPSCGAL
eukprot:8472763-Alexandrium_andersonii.AAC.1